MNIVEAYLTHSTEPRRSRNASMLSVTFELLESMLELPSNVRISGIIPNYFNNTLDFVLESNVVIPGVTFEVTEGSTVPRIGPDVLVNFRRSVHPETIVEVLDQFFNFTSGNL